jgi:3-hydroxyacyl-[acyl-carrier-protein] dehydratase
MLQSADSQDKIIGIEEIQRLIPHRYPMLMVDRVMNLVPHESALGIKNVTVNESFFNGHFPGRPVMPGVLIVEAMAQTSAILVMHSLQEAQEEKIVYFMSIEEARFRKPVVPGDQLHIQVKKLQARSTVWKFSGKAYVDGKLHAEAIYTAMIVDKK